MYTKCNMLSKLKPDHCYFKACANKSRQGLLLTYKNQPPALASEWHGQGEVGEKRVGKRFPIGYAIFLDRDSKPKKVAFQIAGKVYALNFSYHVIYPSTALIQTRITDYKTIGNLRSVPTLWVLKHRTMESRRKEGNFGLSLLIWTLR